MLCLTFYRVLPCQIGWSIVVRFPWRRRARENPPRPSRPHYRRRATRRRRRRGCSDLESKAQSESTCAIKAAQQEACSSAADVVRELGSQDTRSSDGASIPGRSTDCRQLAVCWFSGMLSLLLAYMMHDPCRFEEVSKLMTSSAFCQTQIPVASVVGLGLMMEKYYPEHTSLTVEMFSNFMQVCGGRFQSSKCDFQPTESLYVCACEDDEAMDPVDEDQCSANGSRRARVL